ncbi:hypothetical protein OF83DRAFT_1119623 [Amylostereum chailletii]|nr:hypothetical protein OF83DRAFT_1119623 [Amylostereum chailletii]
MAIAPSTPLNIFHDIDERIRVATDPNVLSDLCTQRNLLSPAARLPADVLNIIFLHFPALPLAPDNEPTTWLFITHVCRHWRHVALDCALFWTRILFQPPQWTYLSLERAKSAPLQLEISWNEPPPKPFDDTIRAALLHAHHTRALKLELPATALLKHMRPLVVQPADMLQQLILDCAPTGSKRPPRVPDDIFMRNAPLLRRLSLLRCSFSWQSHLFRPALTHLFIVAIPKDSLPSMSEFLALLGTLPNLTDVFLSSAIPELPPTSTSLAPQLPDFDIVHLPHLTSICIMSHILDIADLLRYLSIPIRCRIRIQASHRTTAVDLIPSMLTASTLLASVCEPRRVIPTHRMRIFHTSDSQLQWTFVGPVSPSEPDIPTASELHFAFSWPSATSMSMFDTGTVCCQITRAFLLESVQTLIVTTTFFIQTEAWVSLLSRLTTVESIEIHGHSVYGFAHALNQSQATADSRPLPKLKQLDIRNALFSYPLGEGQLALNLTAALDRWRSAAGGVALDLVVCLTECHITAPQVADLDALLLEPVQCVGEPNTWGIGEPGIDSDSDSDSGSSDVHMGMMGFMITPFDDENTDGSTDEEHSVDIGSSDEGYSGEESENGQSSMDEETGVQGVQGVNEMSQDGAGSESGDDEMGEGGYDVYMEEQDELDENVGREHDGQGGYESEDVVMSVEEDESDSRDHGGSQNGSSSDGGGGYGVVQLHDSGSGDDSYDEYDS